MTGVRELAHAEMQKRTLTAAREQLKTVGPALDVSERALEPLRSVLTAQGEGAHGAATARMLAWSSIHGFIPLELGGHFEGSAEDTTPVFAALVEQMASRLLSHGSPGESTR